MFSRFERMDPLHPAPSLPPPNPSVTTTVVPAPPNGTKRRATQVSCPARQPQRQCHGLSASQPVYSVSNQGEPTTAPNPRALPALQGNPAGSSLQSIEPYQNHQMPPDYPSSSLPPRSWGYCNDISAAAYHEGLGHGNDVCDSSTSDHTPRSMDTGNRGQMQAVNAGTTLREVLNMAQNPQQ